MKLIKANENDINLIMTFIAQARAYLKSQGIDQWQGEYPNVQSIEQDICERKGYLISNGDTSVGYLCLDFQGEQAYESIDGSWLSDGVYAVIHRLAIGSAFRGKGYADIAFSLSEDICKENGVFSIKIDTQKDNKTMQHLLKKNGYEYCGKVSYPQGDRMAFEKLLS